MKRCLFFCCALLAACTIFAQPNLSRLEYFYDTDPGFGQGTPVSLPANQTDVADFVFTPSTASLSNGFHWLYVRAKDANGKWSETQRLIVYKAANANPPAPNLTALEYFYDTDPGFGHGTPVSLPANQTDVADFVFAPSTASLSNGFHWLYVRTKDANGKWSETQRMVVLKQDAASTAPPPNLVSGEYFYDTDPGFGQGQVFPLTPVAEIIDHVLQACREGLTPGDHRLFIRLKDANGKWSETAAQDIAICLNGGAVQANQSIAYLGDPVPFSSDAAASVNPPNVVPGQTVAYQWQKWTGAAPRCDDNFTDIAGANALAYDPPSGLTTTTWYRRKATYAGTDGVCVAHSNVVEVGVAAPVPIHYVWNGTVGNWTDPTRWIPNGVPGINDQATINSGEVNLTQHTDVDDLTLTGGVLKGNFNLSIGGDFNWSGGTFGGLGNTEVDGICTLANGTLDQRTLTLNGGGTVTTNTLLNTDNNANLVVPMGQTLMLTYSANTEWGGSGGTITNQGTLVKNGGAFVGFNRQRFENTGTIQMNGGQWYMGGNGFSGNHTGAHFQLAANTLLGPNGGNHVFTGCTFAGMGDFASLGSVQITNFTGNTFANTLGFAVYQNSAFNLGQNITAARYMQDGGSLNGSADMTVLGNATLTGGTVNNTGLWTVNGAFSASNATFGGSGASNIAGVATLGNVTLKGRTLTLNGGGNVTSNTFVNTDNNANLVIPSGQTLILNYTSNADWGGNGGTITNQGTIVKNGNAYVAFNRQSFENTGTVQLNAGHWYMGGNGPNGNHTGAVFQLAAGTLLAPNGGTHAFTGCTFSGTGDFGSLGTATISPFTGNIYANTLGLAVYQNSAFNLGQNVTVARYLQDGGILNGTGEIFVEDVFFSGGQLSGTGLKTIVGDVAGSIVANAATPLKFSPNGANIGTTAINGNFPTTPSQMEIQLSGTNSDKITTTGNVALDADNSITVIVGSPAPSGSFVVLECGGTLSGTFGGANSLAGYTITYDYTPNAGKVILTPPTCVLNLTATPAAATCQQANDGAVTLGVSGGTAPYTYMWAGPNGFAAAIQNIAALLPGTYTVTVRDGAVCVVTTEVVVGAPTFDFSLWASVDTLTCVHPTSLLQVQTQHPENYTYLWSNGATGAQTSVTTPGIYSVVISETNGCTIVSFKHVYNNIAAPNASIFGKEIICMGDVDSLVATNGIYYKWSTGDESSIICINNLLSSAYTVTVTAANGCTASDTHYVLVKPVVVPGAVGNRTPADGSINQPSTLELSWASANNADMYDLLIWPADEPNNVQVIHKGLGFRSVVNLSAFKTYDWTVNAKNECAFHLSDTFSFTTRGLPDLVVDSVAFSKPIFTGNGMTITYRVRNIGTYTTGTQNWNDYFWLSADEDLRKGDDILLASVPNQSYLLPGESYIQTYVVTLPERNPGLYHLFVSTDNDDAYCTTTPCSSTNRASHYTGIVELSQINNYFDTLIDIQASPQPNFVIDTVLVNPSVLFGGDTISVTWHISNQGSTQFTRYLNYPFFKPWSDQVFLSEQLILDGAAVLLPSVPYSNLLPLPITKIPGTNTFYPQNFVLGIDSVITFTERFIVPIRANGRHFMHVAVDALDDVYEANQEQDNHFTSDSFRIIVKPPSDLQITNLVVPDSVLSGQNLSVTWVVENKSQTETNSSTWLDKVYISKIDTFIADSAILLSNQYHFGKLNNAESYIAQVSPTLALNLSGNFYVYVVSDALDNVHEWGGDVDNDYNHNNIRRSVGQVKVKLNAFPDIVVGRISASKAVVLADSIFEITVVLKNQGNALQPAGLEYALSLSDTVNANVYYNFGVYYVTNPMSPGDSVSRTLRLVTPNFSGRYRIKVDVDGRGLIYELNGEDNNTGFSSKFTLVARPITYCDLAVMKLNTIGALESGRSISVISTIKNLGPGEAIGGLDYQLYLSDDSVWDNTDLYIGGGSQSKLLLVGDSTLINTSANLPNGYYGNKFLLIKVQSIGANQDNFNYNNILYKSINILLSPYPDIRVNSFYTPPQAYAGQTLIVHYVLQNNGTVPINGTIYTALTISTGSKNEGIVIGTGALLGALSVGESRNDSFSIMLPQAFSGSYFLYATADVNNTWYEYLYENNNSVGPETINILPLTQSTADLIVRSVASQHTSAQLGGEEMFAVKVVNTGDAPTSGVNQLGVYLSNNGAFDDGDYLATTSVTNNFFLQAGDSTTLNINGLVQHAEGNFYPIGRVNMKALVPENNLTNNTAVATNPIAISAENLPLGIWKPNSLNLDRLVFYKINVPQGKDLRIKLEQIGGGAAPKGMDNRLYVAYGRVPSVQNYDGISIGETPNPVLLIPETQAGDYYIMARAEVPSDQTVQIRADVLEFSLDSIAPGSVGQGIVTTTLIGAGFRYNANGDTLLQTRAYLKKSGVLFAKGTLTSFVSTMEMDIRWDLSNVPLGSYDVLLINPNGEEVLVAGGIAIIVGIYESVKATVILPNKMRIGRPSYWTIKYKNNSNINLPISIAQLRFPAHVQCTTLKYHNKIILPSQMTVLGIEQDDITMYNGLKTLEFYISEMKPNEEVDIVIKVLSFEPGIITVLPSTRTLNLHEFINLIGNSAQDLRGRFIKNSQDLSSIYLFNEILKNEKTFIDSVFKFFVDKGILNTELISSTLDIGCVDCSLPFFLHNPSGNTVGTEELEGEIMFSKGKSLLWGISIPFGQVGYNAGWDMIKLDGRLKITATPDSTFSVFICSMSPCAQRHYSLTTWEAWHDYKWPLCIASQGIEGFETEKFIINTMYFDDYNNRYGGSFKIEKYGDTLFIVFKHRPRLSNEAGIPGGDGICGYPGGNGGPSGIGGVGGNGGQGSNGWYTFLPSNGGNGGSGNIGGNGGQGGSGFNGQHGQQGGLPGVGISAPGKEGANGEDGYIFSCNEAMFINNELLGYYDCQVPTVANAKIPQRMPNNIEKNNKSDISKGIINTLFSIIGYGDDDGDGNCDLKLFPPCSKENPCPPGYAPILPTSAVKKMKLSTIREVWCLSENDGTFKASDLKDLCTPHTTNVTPCDPNEIIGPIGVDTVRWIAPQDTLRYRINFENDSLLASTAAQRIVIRQKLDASIDPLSVRVGSFGFANLLFVPSTKGSNFTMRLKTGDTLGVDVEVTGGLDVANREVFWVFQSLEPGQNTLPYNPDKGLLPINDLNGKGQGFVEYTVMANKSARTGDTIQAQASIVFDINPPIFTNTWQNRIDAEDPTSHVSVGNSVQNSTLLQVEWQALDAPDGSGLQDVNIYMAIDSGGYTVLASNLTGNIYRFWGEPNKTYRFYARARDRVGNLEAPPLLPDAQVRIVAGVEPSIVNAGGPSVSQPCTCAGNGRFSEEIGVFSTSGETWTVVQTTLEDSTTLMPYSPGTALVETPTGSGRYYLSGHHQSASGYTITVASPQHTNTTLSLNNTCYYPTPQFVGLDVAYCQNAMAIVLVGSGGADIHGVGMFKVDGTVNTIFDPSVLSPGIHAVAFSFDAGSAGSGNPNDPGCVATITNYTSVKAAPNVSISGPNTFCTGDAIVLDANGGDSYVWSDGTYSRSLTVHSSGIYTVVATDVNGCTNSATQLVAGQDATPPNITCPTNQTVAADANCAGTVGVHTPLSTSDNCGSPSLSQSPAAATPLNGHNNAQTVTLAATDVAGNTTTCSFTVTLKDITAPNITCPVNQTVAADANCAGLVGPRTPLSTSDNCGSPSLSQSPAAATPLNGHNNAQTVTLTATDVAGNTTTCSFTVTLKDITAPNITCPVNQTVAADANCAGLVGPRTPLSASDNCGSPSLSQSPAAATPLNGHNSTQTVILTATDGAGNTTTCSFTVTLKDITAPNITCPVNQTVAADANCAGLVGPRTPLSASDNCGSPSLSQSPAAATPLNGHNNAQTVILTATDVAGNTTDCSFTVTLKDITAPNITCPVNQTVAADANCAGLVGPRTPLSASDNCGSPSLSQNPAAGTSLNGHNSAQTVTLTATDVAGNTTICSFTVTLKDITSPTLSCPPTPAPVVCGGTPCTAVAQNIGATNWGDACGTPSLAYALTGATTASGNGQASGSVFQEGLTTVLYTATDMAGNTTTCQITVMVINNQAPSLACPLSQTISTVLCSLPVTYPLPNCMANCMGAVVTQTAGIPSGGLFPLGVTVNIFQATAINGQTNTCSFAITIQDALPPTITCPPNVVRSVDPGQCAAQVVYTTPVATDNCTMPTIVHVSGGISETVFPVGTATVRWRATDAGGNSADCTFLVEVVDDIPPTLTCPANHMQPTAPGTCNALSYYMPTASDNCGTTPTFSHKFSGATTVSVWTSGTGSGSYVNKGITTVTLRATDGAGLTKTCTFRIIVSDVEPPVLTCPPVITANTPNNACSVAITYTTPNYTDNCNPVPIPAVRTNGPPSGSPFPVGNTLVTFRAVDASGNSRQCILLVIVTDNQPPVMTCPPAITTTGAGTPCTAVAIYSPPTASDNCAGTLTPFLFSGLASGSQFPAGVSTNIWYAVAPNGQTTQCSFTVTVQCPANRNAGQPNQDRGEPIVPAQSLSFSIVPNPADDRVAVAIQGAAQTRTMGRHLTVLDAQGRKVWSQSLAPDQNQTTLHVRDWVDGLYVVCLSDGATMTAQRLVVVRGE